MTTNTAALLRHLADVLDAYRVANGYLAHEEMADANDRLCEAREALSLALGLPDHATGLEAVAALRAHADSLAPGLPEGWEWDDSLSDNFRAFARYPRQKRWCAVDLFSNLQIGGSAPASVVRAVLARAQGVGS